VICHLRYDWAVANPTKYVFAIFTPFRKIRPRKNVCEIIQPRWPTTSRGLDLSLGIIGISFFNVI